jgi:flagellar motor switch protein FliN/FliY
MAEDLEYQPLNPGATNVDPAVAGRAADLLRLRDVPVSLAVEIGRARMTVGETLALRPGSIVTLDRLAEEPLDLLVNGTRIARGEVVVIDEDFGLRITEVQSAAGDRLVAAAGSLGSPALPAGEPIVEPTDLVDDTPPDADLASANAA